MKCQGKRWSLFGWGCEIVDRFSTLYWWRILLSGTKPELCLWVILIEIAQFSEAGVWSGVWIPVVWAPLCAQADRVLPRISCLRCPSWPSHPKHEILWAFGSSKAALLLHIHSKGISGSPEESGSWVVLSHLSPSFPSLHFPSLHPLSPLRKKSQNPIKVAFFFPEPLAHKCSL